MVRHNAARTGFTLIELLLVIGIIAILAAVVIVAINPTKQLADARNAQRRSDINTILNAVYQYAIDNNGVIPTSITTTSKEICQTEVTNANRVCNAAYVDLEILTGSYIVKLPKDPRRTAYATATSTNSGTNYWILRTSQGRLTVTASGAELSASITVTR